MHFADNRRYNRGFIGRYTIINCLCLGTARASHQSIQAKALHLLQILRFSFTKKAEAG